MTDLFILDKSTAGTQIFTLSTIVNLANKKKCVWYRGGRVPAAFIQNFQGRHLYNEMQGGHIRHYLPKMKQKHK